MVRLEIPMASGSTMDLFSRESASGKAAGRNAPLAERMRPAGPAEVVGQEKLLAPGGLLRTALETGEFGSMIFWGPPGSGKTTLARLLAQSSKRPFVPFSAVTGGVKEVREIVQEAEHQRQRGMPATILFVDEIHRFNKAQQDAFLPCVESGTIILLGATTENPSFELNSALLSRVQVVVLEPLSADEIRGILEKALSDREQGIGLWGLTAEPVVLERLARQSFGDVRQALNLLEASALLAKSTGESVITESVLDRTLRAVPHRYDKAGEEHYNTASAFIKSLRGSDPDAALYWLARMIDAGEDARFIARRMVIFASEDVGNADPRALQVAVAVAQAVEFVGLPEARINLAQGVTYLALAPKSNASYAALGAAQQVLRERGPLPVPLHLRNAPTGLMKELGYHKGYEYAHDFEGGESRQQHLPDELVDARFYEPTTRGDEKILAERLARLRDLRAKLKKE